MKRPSLGFWASAGVAMVASAAVYSATRGVIQISSDPYTNPNSQHKTEVEPDTFAFGSTIVAAFQVGRIFDGGAANIGFSTSTDGGKIWKQGFLPGITKYEGKGPYDRVSDASVAYDAAHGVWMISSLAILENGGFGGPKGAAVLVSRSSDGLNWEKPVTVNLAGDGGFVDKNWTSCDNTKTSPYFGHCYTEWDDNGEGNTIYLSVSQDGGKTWGERVPTADHATGLGGQPLALPNGTVVVPAGNAWLGGLISFVSKDGGASWSQTVSITQTQSHEVGGEVRTEPLPSAEMDASGKIYLVWQDCRFENNCATNDIVMSTTTDGISWSEVTRIPLDAVGSGVDHFIPGIAVDSSTAIPSLSLTYYFYPKADCESDTCQLFVGTSSSKDGGKTWSAPQVLAGPMSVGDLAKTSQGVMVGDYISSSYVVGSAHPVFAAVPGKGELAMFSVLPDTHRRPLRIMERDPVMTDRSDFSWRSTPLTLF